ncbi:MAG TPA: MauE/DoxX family redox-associated membrane protein [Thermomicrobiales bacterium]|nr:MauE/DoxX family redox-associated membrane protein [Thermomicrobiales bacterium]
MASPTATAVLTQLAFAARLSVGIMFTLSALPKVRRPPTFVRSVMAYDVLPAGVARVFAAALIPAEVFLALAFLTGWWPAVALPLGALVLLAFLIAVGINLRRGRRIPCGCFGEASEAISPRTLARLLLLLAAILLLAVVSGTGWISLPDLGSLLADRSALPSLLDTAGLAVFLIVLAAWLLHLPEVILLVRHLRWNQSSTSNPQGR